MQIAHINRYFDLNFTDKQLQQFITFFCLKDVLVKGFLNGETTHQTAARTPNLNREIIGEIAARIGLTFTDEKEETSGTFAPLDVLDYIYAVLHSPSYREKYKEFLKIDFPRVPFPKDAATFRRLADLGGELRLVHLLDAPVVARFLTTYPNGGDNRVTRKMTAANVGFELTDAENETGRVWINDEQFFGEVPRVAWEFYIGGYQPAQKWLKDRVGRTLNYEDIAHYQKNNPRAVGNRLFNEKD